MFHFKNLSTHVNDITVQLLWFQISGCHGTGLFRAFSQHVLHRLNVTQDGPKVLMLQYVICNSHSCYPNDNTVCMCHFSPPLTLSSTSHPLNTISIFSSVHHPAKKFCSYWLAQCKYLVICVKLSVSGFLSTMEGTSSFQMQHYLCCLSGYSPSHLSVPCGCPVRRLLHVQ